MLYKYPQAAFPYERLVRENAQRPRTQREFELEDTGIFDQNRYFDVFIEYAKADAEDVCIRITVHNRGPEASTLHLLPQAWFRNVWSWEENAVLPLAQASGPRSLDYQHPEIGTYHIVADGEPTILVCDNETNARRLFDAPGPQFPRDAFHEYIVKGNRAVINPYHMGTKSAFHYPFTIPAGGNVVVKLRLKNTPLPDIGADFDAIFEQRIKEADEFYHDLHQGLTDEDACRVQRQAFAGLIWSKQYYGYDVRQWLHGDPTQPSPPQARLKGRNNDWKHVNNGEIISMPDKWEYPWYAAWDLAFHMIPYSLIDSEFAKEQLLLFTREWYMHPNGQLPAYEWNFSDVNPPVHAWAAWRVFQIERKHRGGIGDIAFLERILHKLMLNFTWWINRKDADGRNIFQGGFLGLDNIGVFDRSAPLPTGGYINQADGTAWVAMYCLNLMRIALELSLHNPVYQDLATKYFQHFLQIAEAMFNVGGEGSGVGLWDETDKFYYDQLSLPDGRQIPLKVRSMVGLIPLFAVEVLDPELLSQLPEFSERLEWFLRNRPDLANLVSRWQEAGRGERRLLSLLRGHRMKRLLRRLLDETEFLSDYGIRSMSKSHGSEPYVFDCDGHQLKVSYMPGESDSGMFGGNSNWRGPIWMPVNYLIIESLQKLHHYYGDDFLIECPTGSGNMVNLEQATMEITRRLNRMFLRDDKGRRPIFGDCAKMQSDPHFRDHLLFHEYFDGDTGRGLGATHQTGWTALIAKLLQPRRPDIRPAERGPNSLTDLFLPEA